MKHGVIMICFVYYVKSFATARQGTVINNPIFTKTFLTTKAQLLPQKIVTIRA